MNGQDLLQETAQLISRGWCCGADARTCSGTAVHASDADASSWSLPGALAVVSERPDADLTALRDAMWAISGVIPDWSLQDWNDAPGRTQAETVQMLGRASGKLNNH